ncbi:MAG: permease [bacterium]
MIKKESCEVHGRTKKTVNRTLGSLILMGLLLVVWHVYAHHRDSFFLSFFSELWSLIVSRNGILMELKEVFIYFLIGIMIAGYIRTYKFHIRLRKVLIRYKFSGIFLAALIGVFSPLCSCGILTTVVALLAAGLPLAPAMALLIASPLMSPTTFFLTLNDLGMHWAIVRTLVAFLMGVSAGVVTVIVGKFGFKTTDLFLDGGIPEGDFHDPDYPDERLRCTCNEKMSNRIARKTKNKLVIFLAKTVEMFWLIGKYVLVGIIVGCVVERYIPHAYIQNLFGEGGKLSVIWVTLGSVPIFLHQISASSILYHIKASLPGTMDNSAALAFLIGGPVTAIPAMTLLWSMFKKRVFVLYMSVSILGSIFFAYTFGNLLFISHVDTDSPVLTRVSAVAGGESSIISKSSDLIRVAVDPDKKPIIACYEDSEGGSGIVFDGSWNRFRNGALHMNGNKQYIRNIARWLRQTSTHPENNRILIYNTYVDHGLDNDAFQQGLESILSEEGEFQVSFVARKAIPRLSGEILNNYGQLWILSGQKGSPVAQGTVDEAGHPFSDQEIQDIHAFHDEGNSLLIVAGPQGISSQEQAQGHGCGQQGQVDGDWTQAANQVAEDYGVRFADTATFQEKIPISLFTHLSDKFSYGLVNYFNWLKHIRG